MDDGIIDQQDLTMLDFADQQIDPVRQSETIVLANLFRAQHRESNRNPVHQFVINNNRHADNIVKRMKTPSSLSGQGAPSAESLPAALISLRLTAVDLQVLRWQGFVSAELRGNCRIFKLRFRRDGRQVVRYLGTDPACAENVRSLLEQWQR